MTASAEATRFLADVLAGKLPDWPIHQGFEDAFWRWGKHHGVLPLVWECVQRQAAGWPSNVREQLADNARRQAALELGRRAELVRVLDAFGAAGIKPLLLKGGALAYTLYAAPHLREREDTDLLVSDEDWDRVAEVLQGIAYEGRNQVAGEFVGTQATFRRAPADGVVHVLDMHRRSSESPLLAGVVTYDDAIERSRPIPALVANARSIGDVDALLFACSHRAGHLQFHAEEGQSFGNCLIWLYDIHLLAGALSESQWQEGLERAAQKGIASLCHDALQHSIDSFGTSVPGELLVSIAAAGEGERSRVFLRGGAFAIKQQEFAGMRWNQRLRLLRENLLPDSSYMLRKYGRRSRLWLPWLYLRRAVSGVARALKK